MRDRVLMIDDSLPLHRILKAHLDGTSLDVHSAYDGRSGLQMATELRPAVILLDLDLPDVNGLEVCRGLKAATCTTDIPIVILTAAGSDPTRCESLKLGAAGFLTKPFRTSELAAHIVESIRSHRLNERYLHRDPVTGLPNALVCQRNVMAQSAEPVPPGQRIACIALDITGLRHVNSRFGEARGDAALRFVATVLTEAIATSGEVYSAGAGQFYIVLPGLTASAAATVAQQLLDTFRGSVVRSGDVEFTLCCGAGISDLTTSPGRSLVKHARRALNLAKLNGDGCISVARAPRRQPLPLV